MTSKACIHTFFLEVFALGHVEHKAIAAYVNLSISALAVVLANLVESPWRLTVVLWLSRLGGLGVTTDNTSKVEDHDHEAESHEYVAQVELLSHLLVFSFKCGSHVDLSLLLFHLYFLIYK